MIINMMNFTFGIITGGNNDSNINIIIDSIEKENIPNYEIIIVGGNCINRKNVIHIPFDESIKSMWITKKKNLITQNANYENVVYMHDYIYLLPGWYDGHLKFGNNFDVLMDKILNYDNTRFRDWTLWAELDDRFSIIQNKRQFLLPYDFNHLNKYMYISGSYWVAKRDIMINIPLDENLNWGQSEDVIWSKKIREKYIFSMNIFSTVKFLKMKSMCEFYETDDISNKILKNIK